MRRDTFQTRRCQPPRSTRQRGSVVLFFLLFLIPLLIFGAFAVDLARLSVARNELQNAADAAALKGAAALLPPSTSGPNWAIAQTVTNTAVALNASDGHQLTVGTVQTGYWNLTGTPSTLQATTITPGTYDAPAVQVTVTRTANQNGGPIALLLGGLMNIFSTPGSATAVAVAAAPNTVNADGLFPVALGQCVFNLYWDSNADQPRIDPSTGKPYEINITNGQMTGGTCDAGQWTSFQVDANNVPTIRNLITNGNPAPLSIGDSIWLEPGVKNTLYSSVPTNVTVVIPVVSQITDLKTYVPIVAFAAFHIDGSYGGSSKYIQGHFVGGFKLPVLATGFGPNYGAYVAPRLAL
ncbi:pilus biosynthesis protein TadE [Pandoraea terrae]|uniref:Pilus biosynthesis protein TadE n=1 Tax=Pandoraea terrae TaxID=1537710 RepID=A0A5E4SRH7_9BURK|nr:pilus assembly protein TadG-related protein [Pandoraea terrae]VVD76449.1 pilus biosynthesis protein TadE [Pandoraea terrae]